ncbi:MAG: histidinol dehydrogenase, partial [Cellulomonas sp.]
VELRGVVVSRAAVRAALPRAVADLDAIAPAVGVVLDSVRAHGFEAVAECTARFDGVDQRELRVPPTALRDALTSLDPQLREALEETIARTRRFASAQQPAPVVVGYEGGAQVALNWHPVDRAGIYVPGGKAVYPSTVVMNV